MAEEHDDRERRIAAHIALFGLTTRHALKQFVFPELSQTAVDSLIRHFVNTVRLKRNALPGGGEYFLLGNKAKIRFGLRPHYAFNYQALAMRFGVLGYAMARGVRPFSPAEFAAKYPDLATLGRPTANHYVDEDREGVHRLGYILVDCGRTPQRLVTKVKGLIDKLSEHPGYHPYVVKGRFLIGVASPTEEKSKDVRERLGRITSPVFFRVVTVPKLASLLLMKPNGGKEEGRVQARGEEA